MRLLRRFAPRNDALLYLGAKNTFSTLNPEDPKYITKFDSNCLNLN